MVNTRNILLGSRVTTSFCSAFDQLATNLGCGRSSLHRYVLHNFVQQCNSNQALFDKTKSSII